MTNIIPFPPTSPSHPATRPAVGDGTTQGATVTGLTDGIAVYTVREVADMLSLSLNGTYAMLRAGQLPGRQLGARWIIPKRAFHRWLDELPTG